MPNLLLISVTEWDTRVAFLEDGRLAEFYVEGQSQNGPVGNVYKGRVTRLLPGMAAAFVDVGLDRPAYLFAEDVIAQEDEFFQVWLKGEIEENPPSRRLPPPSLVYMPTLRQRGFPRRINDEPERQRIKATLEELRPAAGGLIARTACRGQGLEKLTRERDLLMGLWQRLRRKKDRAPCPSLLHQELEAARRVVRELYSPEVDRVLVDDPAAFERIVDYLEALNPLDKYRVELHTGPDPIFSHFGLEIDWHKLLAPKVWLKSGGYLLIDPTEALTAIDVNTGRFVGRKHLEETLLKTNLEAAKEIARQLRLRNIGGLIVIDFIDQEKAANRDLVYQTLLEALARDRAKTTALPISSLGLVEMTRQRVRDSLAQTITEPCGACDGRGLTLTSQILAADLMRQLSAEARGFPGHPLHLSAHPQVMQILGKDGARLLKRLAKDHRVKVTLTPQPQFARDHYVITHEWPG